MNQIIFVPVPVDPSKLCIQCKSAWKNFGYDFCSRDCGRKYKALHQRPLCRNCRARPSQIRSEFCSSECTQAHYRSPVSYPTPTYHAPVSNVGFHAVQPVGHISISFGPDLCINCHRYPKSPMYNPYCSFNCRR